MEPQSFAWGNSINTPRTNQCLFSTRQVGKSAVSKEQEVKPASGTKMQTKLFTQHKEKVVGINSYPTQLLILRFDWTEVRTYYNFEQRDFLTTVIIK